MSFSYFFDIQDSSIKVWNMLNLPLVHFLCIRILLMINVLVLLLEKLYFDMINFFSAINFSRNPGISRLPLDISVCQSISSKCGWNLLRCMFENHTTDAVFSNYIASQAACPASVEQYFKWDKPAGHKFALTTSNATCSFNTQVGIVHGT